MTSDPQDEASLLFPQTRTFTGTNARALIDWIAAETGGRSPQIDAGELLVVGPNDGNGQQSQAGHPGDWIVIDGPGLVRLDDRPPAGAEARTLALALISLATAAGMPGSFWGTDSRIAAACEALELTAEQARELAVTRSSR